VKHTREQQNKLLEWAAEGLTRKEINERAASFDPPFEVDWNNVKHAREKAAKKYKEYKDEFESEAMSEGLARRAIRLRKKMDRHALLEKVIEERGAAEDMQHVAGGKTGVLVKDYKGKSELPVYKFDAALLKEMRDLEREIAIELGQWTERKELTGADGSPLLDPLVAALEKAYGDGNK
jgi:hypothetical protein